ncbi:LANO_0A06326g1_1 [Lachancea nothofagi CBS 11611]|uniref:Mitochondrial distribution and morphology protein 12 n=1 Tax=Lachancea nothofagi CBS 11611 TaxID=1266666 RepID=A0A1G4IRJ6_9SACH|nr:LANO_0A06326g1_1 [Lachancea nothofagi CBS 11611]
MSFEINWENLVDDQAINSSIKSFLNSQLQSISLPSYVSSLQVTGFRLGDTPPKIILREISDPLNEFYEHISNERLPKEHETDSEDSSSSQRSNEEPGNESERESPESDLQLLVEIDYKGDMQIDVSAELALNYPSPSFMTLPVKLSISDLGMHVLCLVAYLSQQLFISFLCDIADPILDARESIIDSGSSTFLGKKSLERISLIRSIKIDSEIGEQDHIEGSVLRSVGKLEQFLLEVFRTIVKTEAAWPSWINLDFSEDLSDDEESELSHM